MPDLAHVAVGGRREARHRFSPLFAREVGESNVEQPSKGALAHAARVAGGGQRVIVEQSDNHGAGALGAQFGATLFSFSARRAKSAPRSQAAAAARA